MDPTYKEPQWARLSDSKQVTYTRPLLGSELFFAQMDRLDDGLGEVCFGFNFRSVLSPSELEHRTLIAMQRLRYFAPIVAATIQSRDDDPHNLSWIYTVASSSKEVSSWAKAAVVTRPRPSKIDDFILEMNRKTLPYKEEKNKDLYCKAYLLLNEVDGLHSLFFHGTHCMLDAKPTLKGFQLLLGWITSSDHTNLEHLDWGTEWRNLPVGPVTATGGARNCWETDGMALFARLTEILQNPVITHSLQPHRKEIGVLGRQIRGLHIFDVDTSRALLSAIRSHGYGITHLFESAMAKAVLNLNPLTHEQREKGNITMDRAMFSQERFLVPEFADKSALLTGLVMYPIQIPLKEICDCSTDKEELLAIMKVLKGEYNTFIYNAYAPHFLSILAEMQPPRSRTEWINPYASMMTNFGVVENFMSLNWKAGAPVSEDVEDLDVRVEDISFGHRMTFHRPFAHVWTVRGRIHLQVNACDMWDEAYIANYVSEIARFAKIILEDS